MPKLESVEVVLVHCNLVKNDYQHTSKVLFSFVPNKQFGQLINISPHSLTMMNPVNTEFSFVEVWFTDQTSKALKIEENLNLTLIIGLDLDVVRPMYNLLEYSKNYRKTTGSLWNYYRNELSDDTNNNNNLNKNVINSESFKYKTSITESLIMLMQELPMKKVM